MRRRSPPSKPPIHVTANGLAAASPAPVRRATASPAPVRRATASPAPPRAAAAIPLACLLLAAALAPGAATAAGGGVVQPPPNVKGAPPLVLVPRARLAGYATERTQLSNLDVVQLQHGCGEWAGYHESLLIQRTDEGLLRLIGFPGGPFREAGGHLIVEARLQVGSDGAGVPPTPPAGAKGVVHASNGVYYVSRVVAVDLSTGRLKQAPFDTFHPLPVGPGRFVVLAQGTAAFAELDGETPRPAERLLLWDLETGKTRPLGDTAGPLTFRYAGDAVLVATTAGARRVDGRTGDTGAAPAGAAAPHRTDPWKRVRHLPFEARDPAGWATDEGRPILVPRSHYHRKAHQPMTGACGLGSYFTHGLLLTDEGAYDWPAGVLPARG